MAQEGLLQWEIFFDCEHTLKEFNITGVHVFNWGRSAFLINHQEKLFAFGEGNPCFEDHLDAFVPRKVRNLHNNGLKSIATGQEHAVLLDLTGRVFCWGNNDDGQLGAGNTHTFLVPKQPRLPRIEQISCGHFFTLALSENKEVWFWGRQFKDVGALPIKAMPAQVTLYPSIPAQCISTGFNFATVLDVFGNVHTWGHKGCGVDFGYRKSNIIPTRVEIVERFKHVVSCRNRTAFFSEDGRFFLSGSSVDGSYFIFTEIRHCGIVTSVAASWYKNLFGIVNTKGEVSQLRYDESSFITRTSFTNIEDVFRDLVSPSIIPLPEDSCKGVIKFKKRRNVNDVMAQGSSSSSTEEACLSLAVSGLIISESDGLIDVSNLYNSPVCSDIEIKLSDETIRAHKLILLSKSKYFKKLIEESWKDKKLVDMSNWTSGAYKSYVKYLYTGKLDVHLVEHLPEIYVLGKQDNNEQVKEACVKIWREKVTDSNVLHLYLMAYNCQQQLFLS